MKKAEIDRDKVCIIAGMPRAGTTFLYHTLAKHPGIFVPLRKETDFFSVNYYRGMDWYLGFFNDMQKKQAGFDISPMYFMDKKALERILQFNKNAKVVLIVRHPLEWIFSLYKHMHSKGYRPISFRSFLKGYSYKKDSKTLLLEFGANFIQSNMENYIRAFKTNLLLCDFSIFSRSPLPLLSAIERFVGIEKFFNAGNFTNVRVNASDEEPPRLVNLLMQNKLFADMVTRLFPKYLILSVRYRVQRASETRHRKKATVSFTNDEVAIANEMFIDDIQYVARLFSGSRILLGDDRIDAGQ
jgi:hypothetical protein